MLLLDELCKKMVVIKRIKLLNWDTNYAEKRAYIERRGFVLVEKKMYQYSDRVVPYEIYEKIERGNPDDNTL